PISYPVSTNILPVIATISTTTYPFFFNNPPPTEIYTLSLHDALPILQRRCPSWSPSAAAPTAASSSATLKPSRRSRKLTPWSWIDRKSTRLNSSHLGISYAVFCLKKKTGGLRSE